MLIAGDFNATPENAAIKAHDARAVAARVDIPASPAFRRRGRSTISPGAPDAGAIDFIFLDPQAWKVSAAEILRSTFARSDGTAAWPSDHFPLAVIVRCDVARRESAGP